ncbi:MAG: type IV pilus modification PilV family protein [Vicinamibacterales bacterium]
MMPALPAGPARRDDPSPRDRGASLVEALIAMTIVITTITGVGQLLVWSRRAVWSSGAGSMSIVLATQKLEQLRALAWHVDAGGHAVSDDTTNLSTDPPSIGGSGLRASPVGALHESTTGFVDYLDAQGLWRGTGAQAPAGAAFVRRWAIVPFGPDPLHTVVLHVVVLPVVDAAAGDKRSPRAAHLTTIRTRSVP